MNAFFQILAMVLGVIVMVILFLQNQSLKGRLAACEAESDRDRTHLDELARDSEINTNLMCDLRHELNFATRERNDAWMMLELLVSNDLLGEIPATEASVQIGRAGVYYVFKHDIPPDINQVHVNGNGVSAAITESSVT